jgi:hypothetical protein
MFCRLIAPNARHQDQAEPRLARTRPRCNRIRKVSPTRKRCAPVSYRYSFEDLLALLHGCSRHSSPSWEVGCARSAPNSPERAKPPRRSTTASSAGTALTPLPRRRPSLHVEQCRQARATRRRPVLLTGGGSSAFRPLRRSWFSIPLAGSSLLFGIGTLALP